MRSRSRIRGPIAALALLLTGVVPGSAVAAPPLPSSMSAAGDSITQAYNTGGWPFSDNPAASWASGSTASVNSHYLRIRARNAAINGRAFNDAKTGARMSDLAGQLATVANRKVGYVTILMGANDACRSTVADMTSVATFGSQFASALQTFTAASPTTQIFVASVPNLYQLWSVLKNNGSARFVWGLGKICQSMLANPLGTSAADNTRRAAVLQRVTDYNASLAQTCALYPQCRFDNNAVFNTAFTASDISSRDYFHPSLSGQAKLAAVTWAAGVWAP